MLCFLHLKYIVINKNDAQTLLLIILVEREEKNEDRVSNQIIFIFAFLHTLYTVYIQTLLNIINRKTSLIYSSMLLLFYVFFVALKFAVLRKFSTFLVARRLPPIL